MLLRRPVSARSCIAFLAVLVPLAAGAPPGARAAVPETVLRERAEAFVAAVRAGDTASLSAFARAHLRSGATDAGIAAFADRMREETAELGPIERHAVQVVGGGRALFVYCKRSTKGAWFNYQFRVLEEDQGRLQMIFRAVALEPMAPPTEALGTPAGDAWLEAFRRSLDAQHPFGGVLVVRRGGQDLYQAAQGVADVASGTAITRASRMGMASGSKMFTAVAILQLAQAGKLALEDPLIRHLPDFPDPGFARRATLHQLLTHTAGAGDYWDDEYERSWDEINELRQMLPHVLRNLAPRGPRVGADILGDSVAAASGFEYSNSGYILLGLVIEAATGGSYYDYVRRHIFEPAGMTATDFPQRGGPDPRRAQPYEPEVDAGATRVGSHVPVTLGSRGTSAGGAVTTADDMLRFAAALGGGVLLEKPWLERMIEPHAAFAGQAYGYGVIVDRTEGVPSYGHGGTARGTQFEFRIYPDLDTVMVMLSNYNTIGGPEMASAVDRMIRRIHPARTAGGGA